MNHDSDLKVLGLALKLVLSQYDAEIAQIKDPKHRPGVVQEFEKALHYMVKMTKAFDDLNSWFTAIRISGGKAMTICSNCKHWIGSKDGIHGYCNCPDVGNCESCKRDDVPKIVKVKA